MQRGVAPSVFYGADVVGVSNAELLEQRRALKQVIGGSAKTASVTATLAIGGESLEDVDPAAGSAVLGSLVTILSMLWDGFVTAGDFARTWRHWRAKMAMRGFSWKEVAGPYGAAILTLMRIGAEWKQPFRIIFYFGEVDVQVVPPRQVLQMAKWQARWALDQEMVEKLAVDEPAAKQGYKLGIDWESVRGAIKELKKVAPSEARALKAIVRQGVWPEMKLHQVGLRDSDRCALCADAAADIAHHGWHCIGALCRQTELSWNDPDDDNYVSRDVFAKGRRASKHDLLYTRGLPPRIESPACRPETWEGTLPVGYQGEVYGDGAAWHQGCPSARAATFAVAAIEGCDGTEDPRTVSPTWSVVATVGGFFPSSYRAELLAALTGLRASMHGMQYVGDCLGVLRGLWSGQTSKLAASSSFHADLWRKVHFEIQDRSINSENAVEIFQKVKAHRSRTQAADAGGPLRHWIGNHIVDRLAKQGCSLLGGRAALDETARRIADARYEHKAVLRGLAAGIGAWFAAEGKRPKKRTPRRARDGEEIVRHSFIRSGSGWKCEACGLGTRSGREWNTLRHRACTGPCAMRAASSHALAYLPACGVTACLRCGAWATRRPQHLLKPCPRVPPSDAGKHALRRIKEGVHPLTQIRRDRVANGKVVTLAGAQRGITEWSSLLKSPSNFTSSTLENRSARHGGARGDAKRKTSVGGSIRATSAPPIGALTSTAQRGIHNARGHTPRRSRSPAREAQGGEEAIRNPRFEALRLRIRAKEVDSVVSESSSLNRL